MNRSQLRHSNKNELKKFLTDQNVSFDENASRDELFALAISHVKALEDQGLSSKGPEGEDLGDQSTGTPETPAQPPSEAPAASDVEPTPSSTPMQEEPQTFTEEDEGKRNTRYDGMNERDLMIELHVLGFENKEELRSHLEAFSREQRTLIYERTKLDEYARQLEQTKLALAKKEEDMEEEEKKLQVLTREQSYYLEEIVKHKNDPNYTPISPEAIRGKAEIGAQRSLDARKENRRKEYEEEKKKQLDMDFAKKREAAKKAADEFKAAENAAAAAGVDVKRKQQPVAKPMDYKTTS